MSALRPVLRFVPRPSMEPFGEPRSIYCFPIAGRPLYHHLIDAFVTAASGSDPVLWIDDPVLQRDERAVADIRTRGDVVLAMDEEAGAAVRETSTFPAAHDACLRFEYPWDLLAVTRVIVSSLPARISPDAAIENGVEITGNVTIESGARVLAGARLKGSVYVGPGTFVGNNASVRGVSSVGANSVIGAAADVKNSLLGNEAGIGTLCFVGDSVFDERVWIAGVARTSNTRLDAGTVSVIVDGRKVDTGLTSLGVFVGADSQIGSNVLILPGRKVGPGALIGPHVIVDKNIEARTRVVLRQQWSVSDR
jgi:UDP-3-O-[3-hydroxymyristoyl] glucosamine N-acyltransferase